MKNIDAEKSAKHCRLSLFRYETFLPFLTFSLSTRGERGTIFTMLTVPTSPAVNFPIWTGPAQSQISTDAFLKNHQKSQPLTSGHDVIHTPVLFPIWGFYYDICDWHVLCARAWTVLNVYTSTCSKPNSSKSNQTEW